jgi:cell shape-determining protein MreC
MEFLGVGPLELIFIILIALIVLGPSDMIKTGRTIGRFLRNLVTSPNWQILQRTSRELRNLPTTLIREAGLEEDIQEIKEISRQTQLQNDLKDVSQELNKDIRQLQTGITSWTTPPPMITTPKEPLVSQDSAKKDENQPEPTPNLDNQEQG